MSDQQRRLLQAIERAFRGVQLGDGVSLHESVVIDNYGDAADRLAARTPDEKHDWRKLVGDPELTRIAGVGGLSFYDAAGFRFHLPAYLSLAVTDFERADASHALESLMFHLTYFSEYNLQRFAILDAVQRLCVRDVLTHLRETYELESTELDQAVSGFWSSDPHPTKHP